MNLSGGLYFDYLSKGDKKMKKYIVLILGVLLLIISFVWMILSKTSAGPYFILAAISGSTISEGIRQVRKK